MKRIGINIAVVILGLFLFSALTMAGPQDRIDPVCGMTITTESPITVELDGIVYSFCSDHCKQAYTQNPAKYAGVHESTSVHGGCPGMKKSMTGDHSSASTKAAGCGGCVMKSACGGETKASTGCGSNCGHTRVEQVNNFHTVMHPLHQAAESGDVQTVRSSVSAIQESSTALNNVELPEGVNAKAYNSARKALQKSVKTLVKSCNKKSDDRVLADFNTMHERYQALQEIVQ